MKSTGSVHAKCVDVAIGAVFGTAVFSQTFYVVQRWYWLVLWLIGLCLIGYLGAGWLTRDVLLPGLNKLSPNTQLLWLEICGLLGFIFIFLIPITVYPKPQTVELIATGENNPLSQSSEVWLQAISAGNYESSVPMRSCRGDWIKKSQSLVSLPEHQPATLICLVRSDSSFIFRLGTHPWSGKMKLIYGGTKIEEDLYSDKAGSKEFTFEVPMSKLDRIIWLIFFITIGLSIGISLAAVTLFLSSNPSEPIAAGDRRMLPWYIYSCIFFIVWLFLLLVFWPGFFSNDIFKQFRQIASGRYDDWHPIFHTLFLWLTTRISFSPTPAVVIQIISLGFLLGWGLSMLEMAGTPRWLTLGSALYLAVSPAVGLTILNPWKDLAYSISITALALIIFHISRRSHTKSVEWVLILLLLIISLSVALFRHNGPPVAALTLVFMMLADRQRWKSYAWVLVGSFAIWVIIRGPIFGMLPVSLETEYESGENLIPVSEAVYITRLHLQSGAIISEEDKSLLDDLIIEEGKTNTVLLSQYQDRMIRLAYDLTLERPSVTLRYFARKASFVFRILRTPGSRFGYVGLDFVENPYGIKLNSKLPQLVPSYLKLKAVSESPDFDWLFWRNAFWMYLLLLGGVTASIRMKNWMYFGSVLPAILNALPYSLVASPQGRYIFPTIILGPLLGLCLLFVRTTKQKEDGDYSSSIEEQID